MARPKEGKSDILILYEASDSEDWVEYLKSTFDDCPETITITTEAKDLVSSLNAISQLSTKFTVILLVISQKMLITLRENVSVLSGMLHSHGAVVMLKLYIDDVNFDDEFVQYYYDAKKWKCFSIGNEDGEDHVRLCISEIINVLQECKSKPQTSIYPNPRQSYIQLICPDRIRQGGELVTLVLRRPLEEGRIVQVKFGNTETDTIVDTERLNQFCFTFKAPANKAGRVRIYLIVDGRKMCKHSIYYSSMTKFAYTCPEFLCQLIDLKHDDSAGLDRALASIFKNSAPQDGSLEKLLTPRVLESTSTATAAGVEDVGELPTLLHFACKYGLNDLATAIIDSPGAQKAIHMDNERGLKPIHLAEENKNEDLVNYIEAFMEMHDYVTEAEEIYEKMSGGKLINYANMEESAKAGYLDMHHKKGSVEEAYVKGRPTQQESDYEITSGQKGLVDEVLPEDDVAPEIPARPPKPASRTPSQIRKVIQVNPSPPQPHDDWHKTGCIPADDKVFSGSSPLSPCSMGSSNLDELHQYQEAFRNGELQLEDIERLYEAWNARNKHVESLSFKERKKQIDELRNQHANKIPKKKKSYLPWKNKTQRPNITIQHNVEPNNYETWSVMRGGDKSINRDRSSCDSCISNASTVSSSSSSSRDSALGTVMESDSDQEEPQEAAPPVPRRNKTVKTLEAGNRTSWGEQYLHNAKKHSRLPTPPSQKYQTYRSQQQPSNPVPPPRPPKVKGQPRV